MPTTRKLQSSVPNSLHYWFFIHFLIDFIFAIPLILIPVKFLAFLGWTTIDPFVTRLVGAALIAIGGVSLLKINKGLESYLSLLSLKILWSSAALVVMFISMLGGSPRFGWIVFGIFLIFFIVWNYYLIKLKN